MQSVLVAAQEVQIFVGQKECLASALGRHVAPRPALEGRPPRSQPCQANRSAPPACGRAHGCGPRCRAPPRISAYPPGPTAKAMSANPKARSAAGATRPCCRRPCPPIRTPGWGATIAHDHRRAYRAEAAGGSPALPDFDIDKGQLFRHERGFMSMLAPGAWLSWLFLFHLAMIVALRHALPRTFAPWKAGSIIVP